MPPSSRQTFARTAPPLTGLLNQLCRSAPIPVKLTRPTRESLDERRAHFRAEALHGGDRRRRQTRVAAAACRTRSPVNGVSSCDLATTALPHSSAGNAFHAMPASGLLNGMIAAQTPIGAHRSRTLRFGIGLVIVLP